MQQGFELILKKYFKGFINCCLYDIFLTTKETETVLVFILLLKFHHNFGYHKSRIFWENDGKSIRNNVNDNDHKDVDRKCDKDDDDDFKIIINSFKNLQEFKKCD